MSVEYDRAPARLPIATLAMSEKRLLAVTVEEADAARRHAAEIGDYVMAQRWLRLEQRLATDQELPTERQ